MAGTPTPIFPQTVKNYVAVSATTTQVTIVTGGTNGTKIESLNVSSTDGSAQDIVVWMIISAVSYQLTRVTIPANSGNSATIPAVDLLRNAQFPSLAYDPNGNKYLYVANGSTLKIATINSISTITYFAQGGDF